MSGSGFSSWDRRAEQDWPGLCPTSPDPRAVTLPDLLARIQPQEEEAWPARVSCESGLTLKTLSGEASSSSPSVSPPYTFIPAGWTGRLKLLPGGPSKHWWERSVPLSAALPSFSRMRTLLHGRRYGWDGHQGGAVMASRWGDPGMPGSCCDLTAPPSLPCTHLCRCREEARACTSQLPIPDTQGPFAISTFFTDSHVIAAVAFSSSVD